MRYFLMVVGFLAGAAGVFGYGSARPEYERLCLAIFIAGAVCFAAGAATVDIVEQIKAGQKSGDKGTAPL